MDVQTRTNVSSVIGIATLVIFAKIVNHVMSIYKLSYGSVVAPSITPVIFVLASAFVFTMFSAFMSTGDVFDTMKILTYSISTSTAAIFVILFGYILSIQLKTQDQSSELVKNLTYESDGIVNSGLIMLLLAFSGMYLSRL